jgi:hypothetical protein
LGVAGPSVQNEVNVCSYARNARKKVSSSQRVAGIAVILLPEKTAYTNCRQIDQPVQENTSPPAGGVTVIGFYKPVNQSIFLFFPAYLPWIFPAGIRIPWREVLLPEDMRTGGREVPVCDLPVVPGKAGGIRMPENRPKKKGEFPLRDRFKQVRIIFYIVLVDPLEGELFDILVRA